MFSKTVERRGRSAAWRISLWSGVAFAIGTAIAFWFLQSFLAHDIQSRADSWVTGELEVLADVAERTPANQLHDAVVDEIAELASREAPHDEAQAGAGNNSVFFMQITPGGQLKLHTGAVLGPADPAKLQRSEARLGSPATVAIHGYAVPFRVAETQLPNGDRIYLGLSTRYEQKVLRQLRVKFTLLWCAIFSFGTFLVFYATRRTLRRVQVITETAESIGSTNLRSRIPSLGSNDEISRLSLTLNRMLDRVESSMEQLHTISDALAHDLRSPMTSLRGKLELALMSSNPETREEAIAYCIDEVDRVSSMLSTSLDVSEASADALRLRQEPLDLDATLRSIVELYEPAFAHAGLSLHLQSSGTVLIQADASLLQRTVANLLENELKHLVGGRTITVALQGTETAARVLVEDDGPGFSDELLPHVFDRYIKGPHSAGHGLGLAFVAAVVRSHGGSVNATNRPAGGASIAIELPRDLQLAHVAHTVLPDEHLATPQLR